MVTFTLVMISSCSVNNYRSVGLMGAIDRRHFDEDWSFFRIVVFLWVKLRLIKVLEENPNLNMFFGPGLEYAF